MANRIFEGPISLHKGTAAKFATNNPILVSGEMGVELDTLRFKIGDGQAEWNDLPYASSPRPVVGTAAPTSANNAYEIGTLWINSTDKRAYILVTGAGAVAAWSPIVTPDDLSDLGGGDMLASVYASNGAPGKVDTAVTADKLSATRTFSLTEDVTGTVTSDLSGNLNIAATLAEVGEAGTYTKVTTDEKGRVIDGGQLTAADIPDITLSKIADAGTAAAADIGIDPGNVPVLDTAGKLASSVIPSVAVIDRFEVADQAGLVSLTDAEPADIAVTPDAQVFMLVHDDPTVASNWVRLTLDPSTVTGVNGQEGPNVVLTTSDITEGTNKYYTDDRVEAVVAASHTADLADGASVLMSTDTFAWDGGLET